jgi:hypothetical protein
MPEDDTVGRHYYPAPLPAGPWLIPLFWLVAVVLAALLWWSH